MATTLLVVRHGQSEWNAEGRWQGWADPPLSSLGRRQARQAAGRVGAVAAAATSDLRRAGETAAIMAEALGLADVATDEGLRERDVGDWTGLTRVEIERGWPDALRLLGPPAEPPGAEPLDQFDRRVLAALARVAARHAGARVLVVAHGGTVRTLERRLGLEARSLPNLGGLEADLDAEGAPLNAGRVLLLAPESATLAGPAH